MEVVCYTVGNREFYCVGMLSNDIADKLSIQDIKPDEEIVFIGSKTLITDNNDVFLIPSECINVQEFLIRLLSTDKKYINCLEKYKNFCGVQII